MNVKETLTLIVPEADILDCVHEALEKRGYKVLVRGKLEYDDAPRQDATDETDTTPTVNLVGVVVEPARRRRRKAEGVETAQAEAEGSDGAAS